MENNKEGELLKKVIEFDEIFKLIKLCTMFPNNYESFEYEWEGKTYYVDKNCYSISIECSDGKYINISYDCNSKDDYHEYIDLGTSFETEAYFISFDLSLYQDGIDLTLPTEELKKLFKISCSVKDMNTDYKIDFDLDKDNGYLIRPYVPSADIVREKLEFTEDGIKNGDYFLTSNGSRIISYKGVPVPSCEELKRLDLAKEKEKISEALKMTEANELTKTILLKEFAENGSINQFMSNVLTYNKERMMLLELFAAIRKTLLSHDKMQISFSKRELENVYTILLNTIVNSIDEEVNRLGK